uniref:Axin 2 n=1 Tax=Cavia porcellus TaxID=10141 RepID=A0A286X9X8_CAVPO
MSSAVLVTRLPDPSSSFREDAPRPPVPGEEGDTPPCQPGVGKGQATKPMPVSSNARRNEDGLGEPEGRASPDSPLTSGRSPCTLCWETRCAYSSTS